MFKKKKIDYPFVWAIYPPSSYILKLRYLFVVLCFKFLIFPLYLSMRLKVYQLFPLFNCAVIKNTSLYLYPLFMIRFTTINPISPINLLQQNQPHQLMRKSHLRKRQLKIGPLHHLIRKP